ELSPREAETAGPLPHSQHGTRSHCCEYPDRDAGGTLNRWREARLGRRKLEREFRCPDQVGGQLGRPAWLIPKTGIVVVCWFARLDGFASAHLGSLQYHSHSGSPILLSR